jgi:hypothetical protein
MRKFWVYLFVLLACSTFVTSADARVLVRDNNVVKIGENVNMGADMNLKDIVVIKGDANIKGTVAGDVVAVFGKVHIFPTARVTGDIVTIGGLVIKDAGSIVGGEITQIAIGGGKEAAKMNMAGEYGPYMGSIIGGTLFFKVMILLGFIGLAMVVISFMTKQVGVISSKIETQLLNSLLWGVLGTLLILPVALLLAITIIGIPLIFIEMLFLSVAMTLGYLAMSQLIGKSVTKALKKAGQPMLLEVIWGLLILFLIELIPGLGMVVKCAALTIGFGAAILTKLGSNA